MWLLVTCLKRGADCLHMVQLMPMHPKTPSSLASFKSRLVFPFWYRLTQVVLEKRPLNGCSSILMRVFTSHELELTNYVTQFALSAASQT